MPRWKAGNQQLYSASAGTTRLNDNAVNDTTTGQSHTDTVGPFSAVYITGSYDFGSAVAFDQIKMTSSATIGGGWSLHYSNDDITLLPINDAFPGFTGFQSQDESFAEITARYVYAVAYDQSDAGGPATVVLSDFRVFNNGVELVVSNCNLPDASKDLTRGTTAHFVSDGTTGPTIDEWEIYRCINDTLTLIDSGDLGHAGLAGYLVARSLVPGKNYSIYAPPNAVIATDYEARIDDAGDHSINFNIVAPAGAGATLMAVERPSVFEEFRHGFQPSGDQAVQANRKLKHARMGIPDPQQQSSHAMEQGGDGTVDLVPYKEWTDLTITVAEISYQEKIELLYMLFGEPYIKAVPGASLAKDVIWLITTDRLEAAARVTVEQGQEDYPSRIKAVELMSGTFTLGKQNNSAEFNGIGRKLDEELAAFTVASPTEPSYVPINAARNNHYLGTAYSTAGTATVGCDVHNATITFPQRRQALFTQCEEGGETSNTWKDTVRVAAPPAITLEMSQTVRSRQLSRDIRNKTKYFYRYINRSDVNIEPGFPYEDEFAAPVKLDDRSGGDTDAVTTGVHNMIPIKDSWDPVGLGTPAIAMFRVRAPWTAKPTSTNV